MRFWIDRGGTFTDIVGMDSEGALHVEKLLSHNPKDYDDAAIEGIRRFFKTAKNETLPLDRIEHVRMGTTVATNALLERKGSEVLLVVNRGFKDLLKIGRQTRAKLFELEIRRPSPLSENVIEVEARVDLKGNLLAPLNGDEVFQTLCEYRDRGITSCAVSLINSWKYGELEKEIGALAEKAGFKTICLSHKIDPLIGYLERTSTTLVEAYLKPPLENYISSISEKLDNVPVHFMQSSGGLVEAEGLQAKDAILSGPSGGVVGALKAAKAMGFQRVIGFDMGGTSTDVSVCDEGFHRTQESNIEGVILRAPMIDMSTIATGGGSVIRLVHGRLQSGPESAGALPGPAAYRNGGPATVTDANIILGRIQPKYFPRVFGPEGNLSLSFEAACEEFRKISEEIHRQSGEPLNVSDVALGGLKIAVEKMVQAIKKVTLERGLDPKDFVLQCFGGAGGQHACLVAQALGLSKVIVNPLAGVLSAFGIGISDEINLQQNSIELALDETSLKVAKERIKLIQKKQKGEMTKEGVSSWRSLLQLRYEGSHTKLEVELTNCCEDIVRKFEHLYKKRFGFFHKKRRIILDSVMSEARRVGEEVRLSHDGGQRKEFQPVEFVQLWSGGGFHRAPLFQRKDMPCGVVVRGPALIVDEGTTTVVDVGWQAEVEKQGEILLTYSQGEIKSDVTVDKDVSDAVTLELFSNRFMAVAEHMGVVLRDTAESVNIRERLDFSCGIFDGEGQLLANAPHVPVHLGAMGESVRVVLKNRRENLSPGDMIVLNNPFNGGSHLPDITVIAPVFDSTNKKIQFFVANRGHHEDVGGLTPGSTPPHSTRLEEEGIVIDDFLICHKGEFRESEFRDVLKNSQWPARNPDSNVANIQAQVAANIAGIEGLNSMAVLFGWKKMNQMSASIMDNAEASMRETLVSLSEGQRKIRLDDGSTIAVATKIDKENQTIEINFNGTSPQHSGNFNAPVAIARSAVLYVLRCLSKNPLPLNEGCLRPVKIVVPEKSLLSPEAGAAVVAGNTEVSQKICVALLGAFRVSAATQGTMNNLLFGNKDFQYYETIGGGSGAGPHFHGESAVHTHMTNTRITDAEILELNYPLRLETFSLRPGSGGGGKYQGGDGIIRGIKVLSDLTATFVASSRKEAPFGLSGGGDGAKGLQYIIEKKEGRRRNVEGIATVELKSGDTFVVETPGGGGYSR